MSGLYKALTLGQWFVFIVSLLSGDGDVRSLVSGKQPRWRRCSTIDASLLVLGLHKCCVSTSGNPSDTGLTAFDLSFFVNF